MPETSAPTRRRWFRFSLRSLLMVVTAFGVWLGWEMHIVRERQQTLRWIEQENGYSLDAEYFASLQSSLKVNASGPWEESRRRCAIPIVRRWLGDRSIQTIMMPRKATPKDFNRIESLFPGSKVISFGQEISI